MKECNLVPQGNEHTWTVMKKTSCYKLLTVHVESPESSEATCKPFSKGLTLVSGTFKITSVAALEALSLPVPTCTHCKEKASVTHRLLSYILGCSSEKCIPELKH